MFDPYEYDPASEMKCPSCEDNEDKLDNIKDWLEEVIQQLYYKENLSVSDLVYALEELCSNAGVTFPSSEPTPLMKWHPLNLTLIKNYREAL